MKNANLPSYKMVKAMNLKVGDVALDGNTLEQWPIVKIEKSRKDFDLFIKYENGRFDTFWNGSEIAVVI